jgi:ribosome production factor 2
MIEFGVEHLETLESFKGQPKKALGSKPCFLFAGDAWEQDLKLQRIKSLLLGG